MPDSQSERLVAIPHPRQQAGCATVEFPTERWQEAATAMRLALAGMGCCRHDSDDIVNDVAVRLLTTRFEAGQLVNPVAWSLTVARRLYLDQLRSAARRDGTSVDQLHHLPDQVDVEKSVQHRLDLTAVLTAIAALPETDRLALLNGDNDRPMSSAERVRRHRIRNSIRTAAGLVGAAVLLSALGATNQAHQHRPRTSPTAAHRHFDHARSRNRPV
jgi:hypothetical protein